MKTVMLLIFLLFSFQSQAACRCTCDLADRNLCASAYDLDNPCNGICPMQSPTMTPIGRTACPTVRVYNPNKEAYVWIASLRGLECCSYCLVGAELTRLRPATLAAYSALLAAR